jgi:hypothetical protein
MDSCLYRRFRFPRPSYWNRLLLTRRKMLKKVIAQAVPAVAILTWLIVARITIMAFVTTLVLPVATTRRLSIRYAIPSAFVYLLFFIANAMVMAILDPIFRSIEAIGFDAIICLSFDLPIDLLLLTTVAFCGWLGTRMRLVNQSKFRSSNNTSMDPKKP